MPHEKPLIPDPRPLSPVLLSEEVRRQLPARERGVYNAWLSGIALDSVYSPRSLARWRERLLALTGIDVVATRPGSDEGANPAAGTVTYFVVRVAAEHQPGTPLFAAHEKGEAYLGRDGRVAGFDAAARLQDEEVARAFAAARAERLQALYGSGTELLVERTEERGLSPRAAERLARIIERDTARVRARLRSGEFAPNVVPPGLMGGPF